MYVRSGHSPARLFVWLVMCSAVCPCVHAGSPPVDFYFPNAASNVPIQPNPWGLNNMVVAVLWCKDSKALGHVTYSARNQSQLRVNLTYTYELINTGGARQTYKRTWDLLPGETKEDRNAYWDLVPGARERYVDDKAKERWHDDIITYWSQTLNRMCIALPEAPRGPLYEVYPNDTVSQLLADREKRRQEEERNRLEAERKRQEEEQKRQEELRRQQQEAERQRQQQQQAEQLQRVQEQQRQQRALQEQRARAALEKSARYQQLARDITSIINGYYERQSAARQVKQDADSQIQDIRDEDFTCGSDDADVGETAYQLKQALCDQVYAIRDATLAEMDAAVSRETIRKNQEAIAQNPLLRAALSGFILSAQLDLARAEGKVRDAQGKARTAESRANSLQGRLSRALSAAATTVPTTPQPNTSLLPAAPSNVPVVPDRAAAAREAVDRGLALGKAGDYEGAIQECTRAIELDPKYAIAYNNRGCYYYKKQQQDLAIADYSRAIELDPKCVLAYANRGAAYRLQQQYDLAIADYTRAIELDPKYMTAYCDRGLVYSDKQQYDLAIADYAKAIQLDPKHALAHYNRAVTYYRQGKAAEARADAARSKELGNTNDWFGLYGKLEELADTQTAAPAPQAAARQAVDRGLALGKAGDYEGAIQECTRAIELDPKYAIAYNNRGLAYHDKQRYDLAIADYTRAVELDPNYVWAYNNRGRAYHNTRQYDLAIADYTKAMELDPKYVWAHYNRAVTYYRQGKAAEARADAARSKELGNTNDWFELYKKLGL